MKGHPDLLVDVVGPLSSPNPPTIYPLERSEELPANNPSLHPGKYVKEEGRKGNTYTQRTYITPIQHHNFQKPNKKTLPTSNWKFILKNIRWFLHQPPDHLKNPRVSSFKIQQKATHQPTCSSRFIPLQRVNTTPFLIRIVCIQGFRFCFGPWVSGLEVRYLQEMSKLAKPWPHQFSNSTSPNSILLRILLRSSKM